jgi:hypothetical protein
MCVGPAIALAGLQMGSSMADYMSGTAAAKAEDKFNKQMYELNKKNAEDSARFQYASMVKRISEAETTARTEMDSISREFEKRIGFSAVSATEAGIGGSAATSVVTDLKQAMLKGHENALIQYEFEKSSALNNMKGIEAETVGRVQSGYRPPARRPNLFGSLLNGAIGGLTTAAQVGGKKTWGDLFSSE